MEAIEETSTCNLSSLWPPTLLHSDTDDFLASTSASCSTVTIASAAPSAANPTAEGAGVRCNFHAKEEVPLLNKWYRSNQRPTESALQRYADILNLGTIRQER